MNLLTECTMSDSLLIMKIQHAGNKTYDSTVGTGFFYFLLCLYLIFNFETLKEAKKPQCSLKLKFTAVVEVPV